MRGNISDQESPRVSLQQTITSLENDLAQLRHIYDQGVENEDEQRHVECGIQKARDEMAANLN